MVLGVAVFFGRIRVTMVVISVDSAPELGVQGLGDGTEPISCSENSENLQTQP